MIHWEKEKLCRPEYGTQVKSEFWKEMGFPPDKNILCALDPTPHPPSLQMLQNIIPEFQGSIFLVVSSKPEMLSRLWRL